MDPIHTTRRARLFLFGVGILFTVMIGYGMYRVYGIESQFSSLKTEFSSFTEDKDTLQEAYDALLEQDHYRFLDLLAIQGSKDLISEEYEKLKQGEGGELMEQVESTYTLYEEVLGLIDRNSARGLNVSETTDKLAAWGEHFLKQEFGPLQESMTEAKSALNSQYQQYLATLPTPTPIPTSPPAVAATGYSFQSVGTGQGTFSAHVIKLPLSQYTVKTVAANTGDCTDNCPAKPLAQYIADNSAYAGIHGTYFCPPDYTSCSGNYSYTFPLYDSNTASWRNQAALKWNNFAVLTLNGSSVSYAGANKGYASQALTAGISNFPMLVRDGQNDVGNYTLDAAQNNRGVRGAIGVDDANVYLVIASGATVPNMAAIMEALGARHALNLDGGGSAAMHIGGAYKVGPGRQLPNAVVLVRK